MQKSRGQGMCHTVLSKVRKVKRPVCCMCQTRSWWTTVPSPLGYEAHGVMLCQSLTWGHRTLLCMAQATGPHGSVLTTLAGSRSPGFQTGKPPSPTWRCPWGWNPGLGVGKASALLEEGRGRTTCTSLSSSRERQDMKCNGNKYIKQTFDWLT